MSESFPFFAIAKKRRVPYAEVLAFVGVLERAENTGKPFPAPPLQSLGVMAVTYRAWKLEQNRRKIVELKQDAAEMDTRSVGNMHGIF